jgi:adenylate kinase
MKFYILMGAPGAGKGTQARLLQDALGLPQVASGDLFRDHLRNQTELGQLARRYMDAGELVPDDVTIAMIRERLTRPDCADGAILDGFPRSAPQAEALDALLESVGGEINAVLYIDVQVEALIERLQKRAELEGRADDNLETIRRRMAVYEAQTTPVLGYYGEKGLVRRVDGSQTIEAVSRELLRAVAGESADS